MKQEIEENSQEVEGDARIRLQAFLDKNYRVIRAMRAFSQIFDGGMKAADGQLEELKDFIETESGGMFSWLDGSLCEIGDGYIRWTHDVNREDVIHAVKGFYFNICLDGQNFECVDLDFGLSRKYLDQKNPEGKREFVKQFAERVRSPLIYEDESVLPLGFTAFISDTGEGFKIEELVSFRDTNPPNNF